jgi:hypothetical protein
MERLCRQQEREIVMSVRLGLAKVAGLVAGTALIGGGAVHVAEKASSNKPQYVKHAKAPVRKAAVRTQVVTKQVVVQQACCAKTTTKTAMVPMPPGLPPADLAPSRLGARAQPAFGPTCAGLLQQLGLCGGYIGGGFFAAPAAM